MPKLHNVKSGSIIKADIKQLHKRNWQQSAEGPLVDKVGSAISGAMKDSAKRAGEKAEYKAAAKKVRTDQPDIPPLNVINSLFGTTPAVDRSTGERVCNHPGCNKGASQHRASLKAPRHEKGTKAGKVNWDVIGAGDIVHGKTPRGSTATGRKPSKVSRGTPERPAGMSIAVFKDSPGMGAGEKTTSRGGSVSLTGANTEGPSQERRFVSAEKLADLRARYLSKKESIEFGENMSEQSIVNDLIREAFTSGDRANTTKGNGMSEKGGTARQMLAGEWFGSVAWPFDQATSKDFAGSSNLQAKQAQAGEGEMISGGNGFQEAAEEIVNGLLDDCPYFEETNPNTVGYLISSLSESGYPEFAAKITSICENASEAAIPEVVGMIKKLEEDKTDGFLIGKLSAFSALLLENDATGMPAEDTSKDTEEPPEAEPQIGGSINQTPAV